MYQTIYRKVFQYTVVRLKVITLVAD